MYRRKRDSRVKIIQWKFLLHLHLLCSWNTSEFISVLRVLIIIFTYKLVELNVYVFHIPTFTHIIFISIISFSYYTMIFHFYATSRSYVFIIFSLIHNLILLSVCFFYYRMYHYLKIVTISFYFLVYFYVFIFFLLPRSRCDIWDPYPYAFFLSSYYTPRNVFQLDLFLLNSIRVLETGFLRQRKVSVSNNPK